MRTYGLERTRISGPNLRRRRRALPLLLAILGPLNLFTNAQTANRASLSEQMQKLTEAMAQTQARVEQSQQELDQMRKQLSDLQRQMAQSGAQNASSVPATEAPSSTPAEHQSTSAAIREIKEHQAIEDTQIATQEQTKVESESRYPVRITGLVLLNGFVNTGAVDIAATPTVAIGGSGTTGASLRQTMLGINASGPHLFGARSYADLNVDFDGSSASSDSVANYSGYYNANFMLLRLQNAHAGLQWNHTEAYFSYDRPIFSPDSPTSLTAVAVPALAWSGNLWTWNPQLGVTQNFGSHDSPLLQLQSALVDVGDAPLSPRAASSGNSPVVPPASSEESRWPGVEARVALLGRHSSSDDEYSGIGIGGYFAPHYSTFLNHGFDSWAATLDTRLRLPAGLRFTGSFYRGLALGGLGGGAYKDFAYKADLDSNGYYFRPLDDVGGWFQLKETFSQRIELNAAFGMDDVFADELRPYAVPGRSFYQNLDRNRTYTGNVIYTPSSYLLFSLEYRHLDSTPVIGPSAASNIIGLGAGYKF